MKKLTLLFVVLFISSFIWADWSPGDGHKMHFPQLPDETGYDVMCTWVEPGDPPQYTIADDWECSETGPVSDIHFWISFQGQQEAVPPTLLIDAIEFIHVSIHSNTFVTDPPYSKPDQLLWATDIFPTQIPGQVSFAGPFSGTQGWLNPWEQPPAYIIEDDHFYYYQVNIDFLPEPFIQIEGEIYWLDLSIALIPQNPFGDLVGWKTSLTADPYPFMDEAVYYVPGADWQPIPWAFYLPFVPRPPYGDPTGETLGHMDLAFVITGEQALPLELSSFTALYSDGSPELHWTTQSELNNMGWNVYRSETEIIDDGFQVNNDMIEGAGTSTTPTSYIFVDENPTVENNMYWYWIESISTDNQTVFHGPINLLVPEEGYEPGIPTIPEVYGLYDNYPNPFNPGTTISFNIPENSSAQLNIYNVKGAKIRSLFQGDVLADNEYSFEWDGKDDQGKEVDSGIYLYILQTDSRTYSKKMVLTK